MHLQFCTYRSVTLIVGLLLLTTITSAQEPVLDLPLLTFNEVMMFTFTEEDRQVNGEFRQSYRFDAQAGDVIHIYGEAFHPALSYVGITTPNGDELLRAEPEFSPEIRSEDVTLQQSGTYILTVARDEPGDYRLHLVRREIPHLEVGDTVRREYLYERVEQLDYTFDGSAGERVVLNAMSPDFDVVMEIYGPDGVLLASDDDSGHNFHARLDPLTLPADGTYLVVLRAYNDEGSGNLYLTLTEYDPSLLRVNPAEPLTLMIAPSETAQTFMIEGHRGDVLALRSDRLDDLDVQLMRVSGNNPLFSRREGEPYQYGDYEYIALPEDQTYRLTIWFEDLEADPVELTIVQVAENALDNTSLEVALSRKTPSRTLVFQAVDHANASGNLRIEQFEDREMLPLRVEMQLNDETFFGYTMADVVGMTSLQMSATYRMSASGIATVTFSLVDDNSSDTPVRFIVTNAIIQGPG